MKIIDLRCRPAFLHPFFGAVPGSPEHNVARWLNRGLQSQISPGGVYAQHSTNYQRLMLSLAVWASAVARIQRLAWPEATRQKLAAATRWLLGLVDQVHVECTRHHLEPGDALLLYTDGVTERRRGAEQFGPERLLDAARSAAGGSATHLVATVRTAVETFSSAPHDDIALLAVRAE